jgi:hypothetical protein
MKRFASILIAAGLVAPPSFAHDDVAEPRGCSAIRVTAPGVAKQPRNDRFSTKSILDLEFETRLERPVHGEHVLRFKVFTPSGFLYQELDAPFSWPRPGRGHSKEKDASGVAPASFPQGLKVQQLGDGAGHGKRSRDTLVARLPVAGTSITMSTLYGRWSVQAFLDDKTRPCSPTRRFTIDAK